MALKWLERRAGARVFLVSMCTMATRNATNFSPMRFLRSTAQPLDIA